MPGGETSLPPVASPGTNTQTLAGGKWNDHPVFRGNEYKQKILVESLMIRSLLCAEISNELDITKGITCYEAPLLQGHGTAQFKPYFKENYQKIMLKKH